MGIRSTGLSVAVFGLSCQSVEPPHDANRAQVVVEAPPEPSADDVPGKADDATQKPESQSSYEERLAAAVASSFADLPPVSDSTAPPGTECRSPDEPGCNPCLVPMNNGACQYRAWQPISNPTKGRIEEYERETGEKLVPEYNVFASLPKCPEHYGRCARCSKANEREARAMHERPECDCSLDKGIDPCWARDSCECWCVHAAFAKANCAEFWGKGKR